MGHSLVAEDSSFGAVDAVVSVVLAADARRLSHVLSPHWRWERRVGVEEEEEDRAGAGAACAPDMEAAQRNYAEAAVAWLPAGRLDWPSRHSNLGFDARLGPLFEVVRTSNAGG